MSSGEEKSRIANVEPSETLIESSWGGILLSDVGKKKCRIQTTGTNRNFVSEEIAVIDHSK